MKRHSERTGDWASIEPTGLKTLWVEGKRFLEEELRAKAWKDLGKDVEILEAGWSAIRGAYNQGKKKSRWTSLGGSFGAKNAGLVGALVFSRDPLWNEDFWVVEVLWNGSEGGFTKTKGVRLEFFLGHGGLGNKARKKEIVVSWL